MRLLFLGDMVGRTGREAVFSRLPGLISDLRLDFVVVNGETASAAEMAADALRSSGEATLIGSRTIGHLLSQSPFDVTDDYIISLPVADYYSLAHGRIEGAGVPPQSYAPSDMALGAAVAKAKAAVGSNE